MHIQLKLIITLFILIFIIGNIGIHLYYKKDRKLLFNDIGNNIFSEIKNIKTEIYSTSKISFSYRIFRSDVILFDNSIFLLLRNSNFRGLISQNQSICQIYKNKNVRILNGVNLTYLIDKYKFIDNKLFIYSSNDFILKGKFEITLDFKNNEKEFIKVQKYINELLE